ncbi:hypothetical protein HanRHA438_Chr10g0453811 [Helianthus annuus]|nr:hypothetical protein HanRHA438_Chr10g0453811 [Helianthus annuus]
MSSPPATTTSRRHPLPPPPPSTTIKHPTLLSTSNAHVTNIAVHPSSPHLENGWLFPPKKLVANVWGFGQQFRCG